MSTNVGKPDTFLIGFTTLHKPGLLAYLATSGNTDFLKSFKEAEQAGIDGAEIMCSIYAKLCYKALTPDKNLNIDRVRDIRDNIAATMKAAHGSVFEHIWLNFITMNCSRVFTHELVRHRVGVAYSQTSGRYVRSDHLDMVLDDPVLEQPITMIDYGLADDKQVEWTGTIKDALMRMADVTEEGYYKLMGSIPWDKMDFAAKKKLTSALRRILPNGQANEMGWSVNVRALRHLIQLRTSRHAEWEIRQVFIDVFDIAREKWPLLFADALVEDVDGLREVTGMKTLPY